MGVLHSLGDRFSVHYLDQFIRSESCVQDCRENYYACGIMDGVYHPVRDDFYLARFLDFLEMKDPALSKKYASGQILTRFFQQRMCRCHYCSFFRKSRLNMVSPRMYAVTYGMKRARSRALRVITQDV